jgi:hypothetical protein
VNIDRFWCIPVRLDTMFESWYLSRIDGISALGVIDCVAVKIGQLDTVRIRNSKLTLVSDDEPVDGNYPKYLMTPDLCQLS